MIVERDAVIGLRDRTRRGRRKVLDQSAELVSPGADPAAEKAFDSMPRAKRKDDATVEEVVRTAIRREADNLWGKKPVCKAVVVRV